MVVAVVAITKEKSATDVRNESFKMAKQGKSRYLKQLCLEDSFGPPRCWTNSLEMSKNLYDSNILLIVQSKL